MDPAPSPATPSPESGEGAIGGARAVWRWVLVRQVDRILEMASKGRDIGPAVNAFIAANTHRISEDIEAEIEAHVKATGRPVEPQQANLIRFGWLCERLELEGIFGFKEIDTFDL